MVLGSIGYGGVEQIREIYHRLSKEGFEILNHIEATHMDYSGITDFRNKKELSKEIVTHDLEYVHKADVLVVCGDLPSYGTGVEGYVAKQEGKTVVLFAEQPVPTPWPVHFSDYIATNERELIDLLHSLKDKGGSNGTILEHSF